MLVPEELVQRMLVPEELVERMRQQLSWPPVSGPESPPSETLGTPAAAQAVDSVTPMPAPESMPASKRRRRSKTRAGRPPRLTLEEIKRLGKAYRSLKKSEKKQGDVFNELRAMLPQAKRSTSNSTFRRRIVKPLASK
jgi:hypothetical protein